MDSSLRDIFFLADNQINKTHIAAIFPNAKQVKNPNGEWTTLPSLKTMFEEMKTDKSDSNLTDIPDASMQAVSDSVETADAGIIDAIDIWLASYYKSNGRNDYFEDGVGKFSRFCANEGFEDDDIETELDVEDPADCLLTEFDDDFPMKTPITDEAERNVFIYGILFKYKEYVPLDASKESTSPRTVIHNYNSLVVSHSFFDISDINMSELKSIYKEQCVSLWDKGLRKEKNLFKVIALGHKHKIPYLSYLVDVYMRDKVSNSDFNLTIESWARNNPYMQSVQNLSSEYYNMIVSAMTVFCSSRFVSQINLYPTFRIRDYLRATVMAVEAMRDTVRPIMGSGRFTHTCPFQMDFIMLFDSKDIVQAVHVDCGMGSNDDDDDDDGDEDDEDDDEKSTVVDKHFWHKYDVETSMKKSGLAHHSTTLEREGPAQRFARVLLSHFETFRMLNFKRQPLTEDGIPMGPSFPHTNRFCAAMNRGHDGFKDLHYFSPPSKASNIPKNNVPEWYFDAPKQYLLPSNDQAVPLTSQTKCGGKTMVFSFHVHSKDEMKVYLYYNGGMMRFFGEDVINVLPLFFDDTFGDNKEFMNSKKIKQISKSLQFVDSKFEAFLQFANS
eukprot:291972_1